MSTNKIAVLLVSRNNYKLMEEVWLKHIMPVPVPILNIDIGSVNKDIGKKLCERHNIDFIDLSKGDTNMQNCIAVACDYFSGKGITYVILFHQDSWPHSTKFWGRFNKVVCSGQLNDFGSIGFNCLTTDSVCNYGPDLKRLNAGQKPIGVVGRSAKMPRWTSGTAHPGRGNTNVTPLLHPKRFNKPFAIEDIAMFAMAINIDKYLDNIKVDNKFELFFALDDICYQFLKQNIYNVVLPELYIIHRADLKRSVGMPPTSTSAAKRKTIYAPKWGEHRKVWKRKWGWDWKFTKEFANAAPKYKGTLIYKFFKHNLNSGPLRTFDIKY